jgi:hypothetical protein
MKRVARHTSRVAIGVAVILSVWLVLTEPFGLGVLQLVVFMAPGALLGLAAGWMASATKPASWTWFRGRAAAIRGALILPPLLAFIVGLDGNDRPPRLLVGFVRTAWLALIAGGAVAVARLIRSQRLKSKRRRRRIVKPRSEHA